MLVLSRRQGEKLVLPTINTSVQIVSVKPGIVRLGIEAPPEVTVLREEIAGRALERQPALADPARSPLQKLNHAVRNRLNGALLGIAVLRQQLQAADTAVSSAVLDKIEQELRGLQLQIEEIVGTTPVPPPAPALQALLDEQEVIAGR